MFTRIFVLVFMLAITLACSADRDASQSQSSISDSHVFKSIELEPDEQWWIGIVTHGHMMPINDGYNADLNGFAYENQSQPLLVSNTGRSIWSEEPFSISVSGNRMELGKSS